MASLDMLIEDGEPQARAVLALPEGFPGEGIHFGMPEDEYHAVPALSNSGIKKLLVSNMNYWADQSWLNPEWEPSESPFMDLGAAYHARIVEGREAFQARYAPSLDQARWPDAIRTMDELRAALEAADPKAKKSGSKAELTARLLALDPSAIIWDTIQAEYEADHEGKSFLSPKQIARIEIAAAMIEKHPQLCKAFTGGHPEVSIFWVDKETGVPCKARLDYLKTKAIVDLKSFGNQRDRPVEKAIYYAVAERKYHIQVAWYFEAVERVREIVRERGMAVVHGPQPSQQWFDLWLGAPEPDFLFVFQQTGPAPVARGYKFPRNLTFDVGRMQANEAKRRWAECWQTYGTDPWLDIADLGEFDSALFPAFIAD